MIEIRTPVLRRPGDAVAVDDVSETISSVLDRGYVVLPDGRHKPITGAISGGEARRIAGVIRERRCRTTLETGVAFGISTLAICLALPQNGLHYGVDDRQLTEHEGAALALLQEHRVRDRFQLLDGYSHTVLPKLVADRVQLDFGFIDGWHTFDYTLLDFFYIEKMLRVGGVIGFHDCDWPAKRKVIRFVLSHRKYRVLPFRRAQFGWLRQYHEPTSRRARLAARINVQLTPNLLMLEKVENWEPSYDYFCQF